MTDTVYIAEIFSSIQGEGGTVRGSCFGKRQIFVRFAGCNLASSAFGSEGCFWCDTPGSQDFNLKKFEYEIQPGTKAIKFGFNPVSPKKILEIIKKLVTPDLHSISFTGGEPLCYLDFIIKLAKVIKLEGLNYPLYLETNGSILPNEKQSEAIKSLFSYCCCDIKDRSSLATSPDKWKSLVEKELTFIEQMILLNIDVFAKLVVTSKTLIEDIRWIAQGLSKVIYPEGDTVGLAIQPVYLRNKENHKRYTISITHLNEIFYNVAKYISPNNMSLSIQIHKFLNIL
ncbi:MAG: 7-carboxy-7-deazaguanine synthase QueE [Promethearchaeota archaeon]